MLNTLSTTRELPRLAELPPDSPYGEAFRLLALNVSVILSERANKGVVILSAYPGDGRSSVAANLALALAQETSVLLVDGHGGEQGTLRDVFQRARKNSRSRPGAMPSQVTPTNYANVWLLNGGASTLASLGQLSEAVQTASQSGIVTIVDTPPAATSSASFSLAREIGQAIYVVRNRKQDMGVHQGVREQLRRLDVEILGLVLNER